MDALTKTLARQLAKYGINVNAVAPAASRDLPDGGTRVISILPGNPPDDAVRGLSPQAFLAEKEDAG